MESTGIMYQFQMMLRRALGAVGFVIIAVCASGQAAVSEAGAFELIDPVEYAANRAEIEAWHDDNPVVSTTRAITPGPKIRVLQPESDSNLTSPLTIDIRFKAPRDQSIDMSSLQIDYWMAVFWKDITESVLSAASVGPDSLRADGAKLPVGRHLIRVQVADTSGQYAEREFRFTVND